MPEIPERLWGPFQSILSVAWSTLSADYTGVESLPLSSRVTLDTSFPLLEP